MVINRYNYLPISNHQENLPQGKFIFPVALDLLTFTNLHFFTFAMLPMVFPFIS